MRRTVLLALLPCLLLTGCWWDKQPSSGEPGAVLVGEHKHTWDSRDFLAFGGSCTVTTEKWTGYVEGHPHCKPGGWCYIKDGKLWMEQPDGNYQGWKIRE